MNLYKHVFTHYSQKDSASGIIKYFLAKNDEEAFFKVYTAGSCLTTDIVENEETQEYDGNEYYYINGEQYPSTITLEEVKQIVIKARGEINMDDMPLEDLYYGRTYEGWDLVKEDINSLEIDTLKELNIIK